MLAPLALAMLTAQVQNPRSSAPAPRAGERIFVEDGDSIMVQRGDRVKVIARSQGNVRAIYNAEQHWLILLIDYDDWLQQADGFVDFSYTFFDLKGDWPLGARWSGTAAIENVTLAGQAGRVAFDLLTEKGMYQIVDAQPGPTTLDLAFDSRVVARLSHGSETAGSLGQGITFDIAEQREVSKAAERASGMRTGTMAVPEGANAHTTTTLSGASDPKPLAPRMPAVVPVPVGGVIRQPKKILNVAPVYPPDALARRVQGVVILQIIVGGDGSVTNAKVLRSNELLDRAALDCVRQWKYEPTEVNGVAVPVIMTVTVTFTLK